MDYSTVKKNIWNNLFSNYVRIALQMVIGLLTFRILFQGLSAEEFGFWVLLWSLMKYGKLFDFGFGFTVQKRVAELSVKKDWEGLTKIMTTVLYMYLLISVGMLLVAFTSSQAIVNLLQISPANREYFKEILVYFFVWIGLSYPLGVFPEVLVGQQRISLLNTIISTNVAITFLFVLLVMHYSLGLKMLFTVVLAGLTLANIVAGYFALNNLQLGGFWPKLISWKTFRETVGFSLYSYCNTTSFIFIENFDRLLISISLSVAHLPIYQAGSKMGEVLANFTKQFSDTLSPASAHLHAMGDKKSLKDLLTTAMRYNLIISTPLYLLFVFYMTDLLRLLTGEKHPGWEIYLVGQLLCFTQYNALITHSVAIRIFMMSGHEKRVTLITAMEAILCLALTIGLTLYFRSVVFVAVGLLLPSLFMGWFFLWPWAAKEAAISSWSLAKKVLFPIWRASLPMLGAIVLMRMAYRDSLPIWLFILECLAALLVALWAFWKGLLNEQEKQLLLSKLTRR